MKKTPPIILIFLCFLNLSFAQNFKKKQSYYCFDTLSKKKVLGSVDFYLNKYDSVLQRQVMSDSYSYKEGKLYSRFYSNKKNEFVIVYYKSGDSIEFNQKVNYYSRILFYNKYIKILKGSDSLVFVKPERFTTPDSKWSVQRQTLNGIPLKNDSVPIFDEKNINPQFKLDTIFMNGVYCVVFKNYQTNGCIDSVYYSRKTNNILRYKITPFEKGSSKNIDIVYTYDKFNHRSTLVYNHQKELIAYLLARPGEDSISYSTIQNYYFETILYNIHNQKSVFDNTHLFFGSDIISNYKNNFLINEIIINSQAKEISKCEYSYNEHWDNIKETCYKNGILIRQNEWEYEYYEK